MADFTLVPVDHDPFNGRQVVPVDHDPFNRTFAQEADRKAAIGTQETRVGLLNSLGAPVDLIAAGLQKVGIGNGEAVGGSKSLNAAADWVASLPGKVAPQWFSSGERLTPETTTEKAIAGAGQGVGTALGMMLPAAGVANTARAGTVTQGVAQALASQPAMQMASGAVGGAVQRATDNPWLGLAAGMAVPVAAGLGARAVTPQGPARTAAEEERRRLVDVLRQNNVPLTTGEITGNKGVQTLESVLETMPLSGPLQRRFNEGQKEAANRLVTSFTGESVPAFTNAEREAAKSRLGGQFQTLSEQVPNVIDRQLTDDIQGILGRYAGQLDDAALKSIEKRISPVMDQLTAPGGGVLAGKDYQEVRSRLSNMSVKVTDPEIREALKEVRNALDAAARRNASPEVGAQFDTVRKQYGNLKTIENSMRNVDAAVGDISPRALGQSVDTANRRGGALEMRDVSAALRKVLGDKMAQSGTQPRSTWEGVAKGSVLAGGGFGFAGPAGAAAALATPAALQVALNNPATRAWAANRLLEQVATLPPRELVGNIGLARALANLNESNVAQRRGAAR